MRFSFLFAVFALILIASPVAAQVDTNFWGGGGVRIGPSTTTCDSTIKGTVRYNETSKKFEYCNDSAWVLVPKSLDDLSDVNAPAPGVGTRLGWDGSNWVAQCDSNPDDFSFGNTSGVTASTLTESGIIMINGISCSSATISITGSGSPQFRVCSTSNCSSVVHNWGSSNQSVGSGQYIQMRLTSGAGSLQPLTASITVDSVTRGWTVTTQATSSSYTLVFRSSVGYTGNLGGVAGADAKCQSLATTAGLTGDWLAWVATDATNDPAARFTHNDIPYRNMAGDQIADNWYDLTIGSGNIDNPGIRYNELGQDSGNVHVWTNVYTNGTVRNSTNEQCLGWTSSSGANNGNIGAAWSTDSNWTQWSQASCNNGGSGNGVIYCFQQQDPPPSASCDDAPATITFPATSGATRSSQITSDIVQITGFDCASAEVALLPSGGGTVPAYRICSDSGCSTVVQTWTASPHAITAGQYLQLRMNTSGRYLRSRYVNVRVNGVQGTWFAATEDDASLRGVFTTNQSFTGNLGGIGGADTKCQNAAAVAGLEGTWKVWLSTSAGDDPESRFTQSSVPYEVLDESADPVMANNWADLTDGSINHNPDITEYGWGGGGWTWTNVQSDGTYYGADHCTGWTTGNIGRGGRGYSGDGSGWATHPSSTDNCYNSFRIYCFQQ